MKWTEEIQRAWEASGTDHSRPRRKGLRMAFKAQKAHLRYIRLETQMLDALVEWSAAEKAYDTARTAGVIEGEPRLELELSRTTALQTALQALTERKVSR